LLHRLFRHKYCLIAITPHSVFIILFSHWTPVEFGLFLCNNNNNIIYYIVLPYVGCTVIYYIGASRDVSTILLGNFKRLYLVYTYRELRHRLCYIIYVYAFGKLFKEIALKGIVRAGRTRRRQIRRPQAPNDPQRSIQSGMVFIRSGSDYKGRKSGSVSVLFAVPRHEVAPPHKSP